MPVKVLAQRFTFLLLLAMSVGLLIVGKADMAIVERLRVTATDGAAPLLHFLAQPAAAISRGIDKIRSLTDLYQENQLLRAENQRLRHWQQLARNLEKKQLLLEQLVNVRGDSLVLPITARVIADSGGPFVRTLLLSAGARDGVRKGQAVVSVDGVIGRIVEVGRYASRVLLLTDLNSRIPVRLETTRYRGILMGDNSGKPRLAFLPTNAQVSPGDRVVTSGDGGLFPPGRPVGVVATATEGGGRVQPFADWDRLEYVTVLRYDLPGLTGVEDNPGDVSERALGANEAGGD